MVVRARAKHPLSALVWVGMAVVIHAAVIGAYLGLINLIPVRNISVDPWPIDFGEQRVGTESIPKTIVVGNSGNAELTVDKITVTGPFSTRMEAPFNVPPGGEVSFTMVFAPKMVGDATGMLTLESNAPLSPTEVQLSGIGVDPTSAPVEVAMITLPSEPTAAVDKKKVDLAPDKTKPPKKQDEKKPDPQKPLPKPPVVVAKNDPPKPVPPKPDAKKPPPPPPPTPAVAPKPPLVKEENHRRRSPRSPSRRR